MTGHVDDELRALFPVRIGKRGSAAVTEVLMWIDTAFNGTLVVPEKVAKSVGLVAESTAEAVLANGSMVEIETFGCAISWFGKTYDTQVMTSDSQFGLVGTELLARHGVIIDYKAKTVEIV